MKINITLLLVTLHFALSAQVGINTTNPRATLDIVSKDPAIPSSTEGLLIPRIDEFPATDPGIDQKSMMVYVTGDGTAPEGFHYWDGTAWQMLQYGGDADFYVPGSTTAPGAITDPIFRTGAMTLGRDLNGGTPLSVYDSNDGLNTMVYFDKFSTHNSGRKTTLALTNYTTGNGDAFGIYNYLGNGGGNSQLVGVYNYSDASSSRQTWGTVNQFESTGGTGKLLGTFNFFDTSNTGEHNGNLTEFVTGGSNEQYGNRVYYRNYGGNGIRVGSYVLMDGGSGTGSKYGFRTRITDAANGTHYGVYSDVRKSNSYAGYFLGRVRIGSTTANGYIFPSSRGTAGQILQLADGAGTVAWANPPASAAPVKTLNNVSTASYTVAASDYTVRIEAGCMSVTLPDAVANQHKIYILVGAASMTSSATLNATAGNIVDDATGNLTSITAGDKLTVQSDGSNWIVISN